MSAGRGRELARLIAAYPEVGESLWVGNISVANADAIARLFANPRIADGFERVLGNLLGEAGVCEHDDFKRIPERWEMLADPGARADRHAADDARDARLTIRDGRGRLVVELGDFEAAKLQAILDQFTDAEFESDWKATVAKFGEAASSRLMPRTPAQRRADAVCTVFERAVSTPPGVAGAEAGGTRVRRLGLRPRDVVPGRAVPANATSTRSRTRPR